MNKEIEKNPNRQRTLELGLKESRGGIKELTVCWRKPGQMNGYMVYASTNLDFLKSCHDKEVSKTYGSDAIVWITDETLN